MVYQGSYDLRRDVDRLKNKTDELAYDYYIQVNSPIFTYKDEVYTPSTLTATAYKSSREITDFFDGVIEIRKSTDNGATYTQVKKVDGHTTSYMLSDTTITHLRVNLYDTDLTLLDFQTIAVVRTTKGGAGQGYDFAYYTTEKTTGVPTPVGDITKLTGDYNEWLQRPKEINTAHPNVFMSYRTSDEDEIWGNWSTPVKYNAIGERGEDGEGLEMIFCRTEYADGYTLDPSTLDPVQTDDYVPTGWTDDQKGVTSQYCFEYVCMRTKEVPTGGKVAQWGEFTPPKLWATFSEDGKDGKGIELIFRRNNNPSTAPTFSNGQNNKSYSGVDRNNRHFADDDFIPDNWTDDQSGVDVNNQCEWVSQRIKKVTNGVASWESFSTPKLWATYSEDGDDAITVMLGNEAQLIPVDKNGNLKTNPQVITIPVYCYKGTTRYGGTINISGISNVFSSKSKTDPTTSNNGSVTLQVTSVPSQITNNEPITVTVDGKTVTKYFTWSKIGDGKDGNPGGTFDFVYYTKNNSTPPSINTSTTIDNNTGRNVVNGWCARPTPVSNSNKYCFIAYREKKDGVWVGDYSDVSLWAKYGEKGDSGSNITVEYAYYTTPTSTRPSAPNGTPSASGSNADTWYLNPLSVSSTNKYCFVSYRTKTNGTGDSWSTPSLWAKWGETGATGERGNTIIETTASIDSATYTIDGVTYTYRIKKSSVSSAKINDIIKKGNFLYTINASDSTYFYMKTRVNIKGADGSAFEQIFYLSNSETQSFSGNYNPTAWTSDTDFQDYDYIRPSASSKWKDDPPTLSVSNQYIYVSVRTKTIDANGNGTWGAYTTPSIWAKYGENGEDGVDGEGLEMIFCRTNKSGKVYSQDNPPSLVRNSIYDPSNLSPSQTPDYVPTSYGWYDNQAGVSEEFPFEYVAMRNKTIDANGDGTWGRFTSHKLWAKFGEDGEKGDTGLTGVHGDNVSSSMIIDKASNESFVDTSVGSVANSVPSDFVGSKVETVTLTASSTECVDSSKIASGSVIVSRMGNLVVINFRNLIVQNIAVDTSTSGVHTPLFNLPSWARPSDVHYFASVLDSNVLSANTTQLRVRKLDNRNNLSGTATYFVNSEVGKTSTVISRVGNTTINQGGYLYIRLLDGSQRNVVGVPIYIRINGQVYRKITDANGVATLTINLNDGQYYVVAWFDGGNYEYGGVYVDNIGGYAYAQWTGNVDVGLATAGITFGSDDNGYYALFRNTKDSSNYPIRYHRVVFNINNTGEFNAQTDGNGKAYYKLTGMSGTVTVKAKIYSSSRVGTGAESTKTHTL